MQLQSRVKAREKAGFLLCGVPASIHRLTHAALAVKIGKRIRNVELFSWLFSWLPRLSAVAHRRPSSQWAHHIWSPPCHVPVWGHRIKGSSRLRRTIERGHADLCCIAMSSNSSEFAEPPPGGLPVNFEESNKVLCVKCKEKEPFSFTQPTGSRNPNIRCCLACGATD